MTPEQEHAWTIINDALTLVCAHEDDKQRLSQMTQDLARVTSYATDLNMMKSAAQLAVNGSKPTQAFVATVIAALAVELPPGMAESGQVTQLRVLLGL